MIFDFHCHLDLMENMRSMIADIRESNLYILAVGTTPKAYKAEKYFCRNNSNIAVACGLHPQLIKARYKEKDLLIQLIKESKYIGEIGLDYRRDFISSKTEQLKVLEKIFESCYSYGDKILSIHSIRSADSVISLIKDTGVYRNNTCILHWFTGSTTQMKDAVKLGCYFSINPKMFDTKSGQQIIMSIPREKIVLETDAPFTFSISSVNQYRDKSPRWSSDPGRRL